MAKIKVVCKRDFIFGEVIFKKGDIYYGHDYSVINEIYVLDGSDGQFSRNGMWFSNDGGDVGVAEFSEYFMDVTLYERKEKLKKLEKLGMYGK